MAAKSKFSRFLKGTHKYLGLIGLLYCLWISLSGIALNHPQLLRQLSLSNRVMPANYQYRSWNRMTWRDAVYSEINRDELYVGGREGVWRRSGSEGDFVPLKTGFPASAYAKDTFCLLLVATGKSETLFAGTRAGLFYWQGEKWRPVAGPVSDAGPVVDLLRIDNRIIAFTDSAAYSAEAGKVPPLFRPLPLPRSAAVPAPPLFRWLRTLHDGSIFGRPGRLAVDLIGLLLFFLALSGLLIWYVFFLKRRHRGTVLAGGLFRFNYRWHLRLGLFGGGLILVTALTGAFSHPPLLLTIANLKVPRFLQPAAPAANPWAGQIRKAAWLKSRNRLIIATRQGFFSGPLDGSRNFLRLPDVVPVHGMGVQVFASLDDHRLLIGSFSGLYVWDTAQRVVITLKARPRDGEPDWGGPVMVTGVAVRSGKPLFVVDYEDGIKPLQKYGDRLPEMPSILAEEGRISLWHALFELHNGRIFEAFIGPLYWFITPLGALLLVLVVLSGLLLRFRRR